jgi:hypothetical protein
MPEGVGGDGLDDNNNVNHIKRRSCKVRFDGKATLQGAGTFVSHWTFDGCHDFISAVSNICGISPAKVHRLKLATW